MRRIDLDAAMAQSANTDAPVVGAPTESDANGPGPVPGRSRSRIVRLRPRP